MAEKQTRIISGSLMEKRVIDSFDKAGWTVQASPRMRIELSANQTFIPDIALYDDKHNLIAIVEVIASKEQLAPQRINIIDRMIKLSPASVVIITNGYAFDIYIDGQFTTQTVICPTMDTCYFLIEHHEHIRKEANRG